MLGEISKRKGNHERAISFYLKGLNNDPLGYPDNYLDLAEMCESLGSPQMRILIMTIARVLYQVSDGNVSMRIDEQEKGETEKTVNESEYNRED